MRTTLVFFVGLWMAAAAVGSADRNGGSAALQSVAAGPALHVNMHGRRAGDAEGAPAGRATTAPLMAQQTTAAAPPEATILRQYCISCHNDRLKTGGLALDTLDLTEVGAHAETWEQVVRKVRTGMMPPSGAPRPPRETLDGLALALEARLDAAADPTASLHTPALHRMNRAEYANAIRDLLHLEVNVEPLLPSDDSSEGFDNLAETLSVSPSLIQGYVSAAMKISRLAVGDRTAAPAQVTYAAPAAWAQDRHIEGMPLGTRGGLLVRHNFPLDAEYEFTVGGGGPGGGGGGGIDVTIDGRRVMVPNARRFRIALPAGPHTIAAAAVDRLRGAGVDEAYSDFRAANNGFTTGGGVSTIGILGPFNPTGTGDTPSRQRIFTCAPTGNDELACARTILRTIARRAYRGPVSDAELATLMSFYEQGRAGGDFEVGIQSALARILVAPRFIYRTETEPADVAAGAVYALTDYELASRLSFFLWSSLPDDELLDLADAGRLREPATLRQQVRRMLDDAKAEALVENFAGQWLYLRELASMTTEAPGFNDNLREAFRKETALVFATIVREDRAIVELLDADYTFVNERLAEHYGIDGVRGSHFRRVAVPVDSPRRGLLGHGSMLTVTSVATRTSPVSRGKWILENLLGAPPPEPPPGVETNLDEAEGSTEATTLRKRLELHRASPVCASCHNIMDPLGFALENFDLIGAWRDTEGATPIDASGRLADGTTIDGPAALRRAVLARSDTFVRTAAQKLLLYALGRPMHDEDMPLVRRVARQAAAADNRFSALVLGIVESDAFQKRVKKG